jgi:cysteine-rich repeat protein
MIATLASGFTAACSQSGSGTGAADASPDRGSEASLGFVWAEVRPVRLDAPKPGCGDGILAPGEDCDDGNFVSGDGCSPLCAVEFGWYCPSPGRPCVSAHACGNAFLSPDEACDDGNTVGGDGCSDDCREVEPGWRCPAVGRPCLCEPDGGLCTGGDAMVGATCGNGIVEPGEACDDGSDPNRTPHNQDDAYGGCTTRCSYGGFCGDGVVNGAEACDEGSRNVELYGEPGCSFLCTQAGYCGDGIVQDRGVEDCDMGPANGDWRSPCDLQCRFILLEM